MSSQVGQGRRCRAATPSGAGGLRDARAQQTHGLSRGTRTHTQTQHSSHAALTPMRSYTLLTHTHTHSHALACATVACTLTLTHTDPCTHTHAHSVSFIVTLTLTCYTFSHLHSHSLSHSHTPRVSEERGLWCQGALGGSRGPGPPRGSQRQPPSGLRGGRRGRWRQSVCRGADVTRETGAIAHGRLPCTEPSTPASMARELLVTDGDPRRGWHGVPGARQRGVAECAGPAVSELASGTDLQAGVGRGAAARPGTWGAGW